MLIPLVGAVKNRGLLTMFSPNIASTRKADVGGHVGGDTNEPFERTLIALGHGEVAPQALVAGRQRFHCRPVHPCGPTVHRTGDQNITIHVSAGGSDLIELVAVVVHGVDWLSRQ